MLQVFLLKFLLKKIHSVLCVFGQVLLCRRGGGQVLMWFLHYSAVGSLPRTPGWTWPVLLLFPNWGRVCKINFSCSSLTCYLISLTLLTAAVLTAEEGETLGRVTGHMLYCRRHLGGCWLCTGLLGHLSALQWEASSPAGARPLLWMWQQPAEPGSTTGSCSATRPPPSLPRV